MTGVAFYGDFGSGKGRYEMRYPVLVRDMRNLT